MRLLLIFVLLALFACSLIVAVSAMDDKARANTEQGKYIVHHVAMCIMCHTPKDSEGRLIEGELLEGAPIPVKSPYPNQQWATRAPALKGLGGFREEDIVNLLTTGSRINEQPPRRPMPPFRMKEEDARAVVAYLKSLEGDGSSK